MGCTHYPFVIPLIQELVGERVRVIDPAPAVARQVRRVLEVQGLKRNSDQPGAMKLFTSGNVEKLEILLPILLGESGQIKKAIWLDDRHVELAAETQRPEA